jgi:hypothetical protein
MVVDSRWETSIMKKVRSPYAALMTAIKLTYMAVSSRVIADSCHAAVFNVDYRLAPEHPFPVGLHDSYDVVKWVSHDS